VERDGKVIGVCATNQSQNAQKGVSEMNDLSDKLEEITASTEEITSVMDKFTNYADDLQLLAEKLGAEIDKFKIN